MTARSPLLFWLMTAERKHGGYLPRVVHADCPFSGSSHHAVFNHGGLAQRYPIWHQTAFA